MNITLIGTQGQYNLENFYERAFSKMGHHVSIIDQYEGVRRKFIIRSLLTRTTAFHRFENMLEVNRNIGQRISKLDSDLVILFKGELISEKTLRTIAASHKTIFIYPDHGRFFSLLKDRLHYFTTVFVAARDFSIYKSLGAKRLFTLPFACDPSFHRKLDIEKRFDVSFIGSFYLDRYRALKRIHDIHIFGNGWLLKTGNVSSAVYGGDFVKTINETKVNIDIPYKTEDEPTMRLFEVTGCGAFVLTKNLASVRDYFDNREVITFSDRNDLLEKVSYYLDNWTEAIQIAIRAQRKCYSVHKYIDRAKFILDKV